jgi:hypothetical protein
LAFGTLKNVIPVLKNAFDADPGSQFLVFEDSTGRQVDFDLSGDLDRVLARAERKPAQAGPGRPKLGVVSREVSLLPRHWEWLEQQPNGASAAIRRLIDDARKQGPDRVRISREAAGRFMTAIAGNLPGYEESTRALYAGDRDRFVALTQGWPADVRKYACWLAAPSFGVQG